MVAGWRVIMVVVVVVVVVVVAVVRSMQPPLRLLGARRSVRFVLMMIMMPMPR